MIRIFVGVTITLQRGNINSTTSDFMIWKNIPDMEKMSDIQQMPFSEKKRPSFTVNNTKMPSKEKMPASYQKRPLFPDNNMNITADYHMPYENNNRGGGFLPIIQQGSFLRIQNLVNMVRSIILLHFIIV